MIFEKKYFNERDVEIPLMIEFIKKHKDIKSVLDIGVTGASYINKVSELVDIFDGVDINPAPKEEKILNKFYRGDARFLKFESKYDLVMSISSIEHYGVKVGSLRYKKIWELNARLIRVMYLLSNKYMFLTFPYGKTAKEEGEFRNINKYNLSLFRAVCIPERIKASFYFNSAPQLKGDWIKISEDTATRVQYLKEYGTRCVCIFEVKKWM
jgi:hypothetical protein